MEFKALNDLRKTLVDYSNQYEGAVTAHAERIADAQNNYVQEIAAGDKTGNAREKQIRAHNRADEDYRNRTQNMALAFHNKINDAQEEIRRVYAEKLLMEKRLKNTEVFDDAFEKLHRAEIGIFRQSDEAKENAIENNVAAAIDFIEAILSEFFPDPAEETTGEQSPDDPSEETTGEQSTD